MNDTVIDATERFEKRRKAVTVKRSLLRDPRVELTNLTQRLVVESDKLKEQLSSLAETFTQSQEILESARLATEEILADHRLMDAAIESGDVAEMERVRILLEERYRKRKNKDAIESGTDQG